MGEQGRVQQQQVRQRPVDVGVQHDEIRRPAHGVREEDHKHHPSLSDRLHQRLVRRLTREATHLLLGGVDVDEDAHVADGDDDKRHHDAGGQVEHRVAVHRKSRVTCAQRHAPVARPVHVRRCVDDDAEEPRGHTTGGRGAAREDGAIAAIVADIHVAVDGDEADAQQRAGAADHAHAAEGGVQARLVVVEPHALSDTWWRQWEWWLQRSVCVNVHLLFCLSCMYIYI